jgi:hypothetical protein
MTWNAKKGVKDGLILDSILVACDHFLEKRLVVYVSESRRRVI